MIVVILIQDPVWFGRWAGDRYNVAAGTGDRCDVATGAVDEKAAETCAGDGNSVAMSVVPGLLGMGRRAR